MHGGTEDDLIFGDNALLEQRLNLQDVTLAISPPVPWTGEVVDIEGFLKKTVDMILTEAGGDDLLSKVASATISCMAVS